ncbi:MAG TPA: hypothetical protein VGN61_01315, partial [Verrucomicrobiae bacterium]
GVLIWKKPDQHRADSKGGEHHSKYSAKPPVALSGCRWKFFIFADPVGAKKQNGAKKKKPSCIASQPLHFFPSLLSQFATDPELLYSYRFC